MPKALIIGSNRIPAAVKSGAAGGPILAGSLMAAYDAVNGLLTRAIQAPRSTLLVAPDNPAAERTGNEAQMNLGNALWRACRPLAVATTAAALIGLGTLVGLALPETSISQKGREFHPGEITIKRGDAIQIVNDDGDLLHHAYIDSLKFSFDSGDQQPGSKTDITFPVAGDFDVLCAIHPKMRLVVHVH
jgi:plastocyanin